MSDLSHVLVASLSSRTVSIVRARRLAMRSRALALLLAAFCLGSCESGAGIGPVKDTPVIATVSASHTAVDLAFGAEATVSLNVSRGGGYSGPVTFSVEGLPAGVVATFTPVSLDKSSNASTLKLTASRTAAAATVPLTIRATGEGVADKTVPLALIVIVPGITATVGTGPLSTTVETPIVLPIRITRVGVLTDVVTLSLPNLPPGVNASFSRSSLDAASTTAITQLDPNTTQSILTLTPAVGATLGPLTLVLRATSIDATTDTPFTVNLLDSPVPTFGLNLASPTVAITAGEAAGQNAITLPRAGGFTGPITLSLGNAPAGVTAVFAPPVVQGTTASVAVSVPSNFVQGTYAVTVRASATGLTDRLQTFSLVVTGQPGLLLTSGQGPATAVTGSTISLSFVARAMGGYALPTVLTMDPVPGFSFAERPLQLPGGGSVLGFGVSVGVAATVVPAVYPLTFRLTGSDGKSSAVTIAVTVTN